MSKSKLGEIGIEDIPTINRADLFKKTFPLSEELCKEVRNTDYINNMNNANRIATTIHTKGGEVFYSKEGVLNYGLVQVETAYEYFNRFRNIKDINSAERMGVIAWIADNIFDLEKMDLKNKSTEE